MKWVVSGMKWIMLVSGLLTCTMLIYGAFHIGARPLILTVAGISKVTFIVLTLLLGRPFLSHQAGIAVVSDVIQVSLFLGYLLAAPSGGKAAV